MGIDISGKTWTWGQNNYGQLGDNTNVNQSTPIAIYGSHTFCSISAGSSHSLAIDIYGNEWTWGQNNYGQLGDNTIESKITPVRVCVHI